MTTTPPIVVAPAPIPWAGREVTRLRAAVDRSPHLGAAALYLRDVGEGLRPAVGLLGSPAALHPGAPVVAEVLDAVGWLYDERPVVVALAADALTAVLAVAPPVGAGGRLEADCATVAADLGGGPDPVDTAAAVRAAGAFVDARVVVPGLAADGTGRAGRLDVVDTPGGRRVRLRMPAVAVTPADGSPEAALGVFSSELALAHAGGDVRGSTALGGWALVESLPAATTVVVDPGLPWAWGAPLPLLRRMARRRPRRPQMVVAR